MKEKEPTMLFNPHPAVFHALRARCFPVVQSAYWEQCERTEGQRENGKKKILP